MDLRCEFKKHAELLDGALEVKCRSSLCGARSGAVVIHRFDVHSGALLETLRFAEPPEGGTTQ
jgi:hypothetical protein